MSERVSKESVKGRVKDIGAKYVSIKNVGDQVKAYVSEDGYASTIQRVPDLKVRCCILA
jgi:hypothetical protein